MNSSYNANPSSPSSERPVMPHSDSKLVAFVNYALEQVAARIGPQKTAAAFWLAWSDEWLAGRRSPAQCVDVAHQCFAMSDDGPLWHALGQLSWGAKEACYSEKNSAWLVIRYVADAMVAFGVAFPERGQFLLSDGPTAQGKPSDTSAV